MEVKLTSKNFEEVALGSEVPVLIDFGAEWCVYCKRISPIVAEIAEERDDVLVCTVDTDEEPELSQAFDVAGIPALFVMKGGKVTAQTVGYHSKEEILRLIDEG